MKIVPISKGQRSLAFGQLLSGLLLALLVWYAAPLFMQEMDATTGSLDAGIWLLLGFSGISFLGLLLLCTWLFQRLLLLLGLPKINRLVLHFHQLTVWEQYVFYWASFALLLAAAVFTLNAVF